MAFQGGVQNITLIRSQVVGGNGQFLQVAQRVLDPDTFPTQFVMNATGSTIFGDMQVIDPGINTADVTLGQGTTWTGASQDVMDLTLTGSTWERDRPINRYRRSDQRRAHRFSVGRRVHHGHHNQLRRQRRHDQLQHGACR
jgi:hypothetical protein